MSLVSVEANFRLRSRENDIQEYNTINATLEQVVDTIGHHSCMVRQGFILPARAKHAILIVAGGGGKCQDRQQEVSASVL
ncbi:hypothetical protein C5G87_06545 [Paenibacillus peoriae]|uniref:hypothetical protein n=1 Tax=Paenibacillus peoriae TaxID=59893 RepID=UPI000CEC2E37|nr:hypothetical protein [Paenibacillus peoriae]PPQ49568.1 hypothetical protein C5G87_06545 [Paenibacillus peoriae]